MYSTEITFQNKIQSKSRSNILKIQLLAEPLLIILINILQDILIDFS